MWAKLLAALIAVATPAYAGIQPMQDTHGLTVPEEYKGNTTIRVQFEDPMNVEWYCLDGHYTPDGFIFACWIPKNNYPSIKENTIVMPNPCVYPEARQIESYAYLMCHEMAHNNGWKH